ncbi:MAG: Uma2 family endonuclease [Acidobacteriaceae bacterium]|nr:Uma2 family endonuclease [Acidobacteriaceae bacterium]
MATAAAKLTVAEFESQYGQEKPYYEYWHGEAVQKSVPTILHALIQRVLLILLTEAGYEAFPEAKLKIDPDFQPIPDVIATRDRLATRFPTKPLEIVIEILSDEDPMARLLKKCGVYQEWGFEQIYIVDPVNRHILRWRGERLERAHTLAGIALEAIWSSVDRSQGGLPQ